MSSSRVFNILRRRFCMDPFKSTAKTSVEKEAAEDFREFKMKQQKFQKDDGLPIFLKAGLRDQVLYYSTLGLAGLGLIGSFTYIIGYANGWYKEDASK